MTEMTPKPRIFKIGATRIVEDASMSALNPEQIRELLKINYPEVANATLRETTLEDGQRILDFLPVAGHKG